MKTARPAIALWLIFLFLSADERLVRESEPLSPSDELAALHVTDGFTIQLFAAEPVINKPINLAFDEKGRLWVSSTTEYPYAADKSRWSDKSGSRVDGSVDAIIILEDTDADGAADKVIRFADGLNIPTGVLPWHRPEHHAGCIAWSLPYIRYFADTTGDGGCDLREVLYGPMGFEKDTHGMCSSFRLGPDGWIYATHGFNNISKVAGTDGHEIELTSGNVFRFRPDGSRIEIYTKGQVNPFGLAFDRRANLYSADCHTAPVYQLIHGAEYPHFSKPEPAIGFGPKMISHTHGSTGICGIVYLDRNIWGTAFNDHILIGNPVNSTVNHDMIEYTGSTPVAKQLPDFITSDDSWFRPVDLQVGPDGALYIADFYNRIIGHYEVPLDHPGRDRKRGRIWRVIKKAGVRIPIAPIEPTTANLKSDNPFQIRAAAAKLREKPEAASINLLHNALRSAPESDSHLQHTLKLAVQAHLETFPESFNAIDQNDPQIARIALAVPSKESAEFLLDLGHSDDRERITHIARFGSETVTQRLIRMHTMPNRPAADQVSALRAIVRGLEEGGINPRSQDLMSQATSLATILLDKRETGGGPDWTGLTGTNAESPWILQKRKCADGIETEVLSSLRRGERRAEQRTGTIRSKPFPAPQQLSFYICGHRGVPGQPAHEKNYVRLVDSTTGKEIHRTYPPRTDVCQPVIWDLTGLNGNTVRLEITDGDKGKAYAWLGLTRIEPPLISVTSFKRGNELDEALTFLATYLKVSAPADLRNRLSPFLPPAPPTPPRQISEAEKKRLDKQITNRLASFDPQKADLSKGKSIFKTHCAICHQRNGEGGLIGPQLDGIGKRGTQRLAEDILDPNQNVDANFYVTTIVKKDGTTTAGFLTAERGEILILTDAAGQSHRIPKSEVEKRQTSTLSLMPPVFGQTLSEADFHDLLVWLLKE
ncbi:MAG: c-type cytochrome [Verrucomicrobiales bacterium]|nr:c-type cytochrome [Verrucomicrobiales bacterium]